MVTTSTAFGSFKMQVQTNIKVSWKRWSKKEAQQIRKVDIEQEQQERQQQQSPAPLSDWLFSVSTMLCLPMFATPFLSFTLFTILAVSICKSLEQPIAAVLRDSVILAYFWSVTKSKAAAESLGLPSRPKVPSPFEGDWFSELLM